MERMNNPFLILFIWFPIQYILLIYDSKPKNYPWL